MDAISPARHPQKSSQHVRACVEGDGAICSKNRKIVPYHGANPNNRNDTRLRSPSPIMAPALTLFGQTSIFGVVFFVFKSLLGIERQKKRVKFTILTRKPRGHVRILMYRTWPEAYHLEASNFSLYVGNNAGAFQPTNQNHRIFFLSKYGISGLR